MPNNDLLSGFSSADINEFKDDFTQMIKVGAEIDRNYGKAQHDLGALILKFEKLADNFNKKYRGIKIKTKKSVEHFKVRLFVRERCIKDFFANSASRIHGLKSVGRANFSQVDAGDAEKFAKFLDLLLDKINISYADAESGTGTISAVFSGQEKMVELIYNPSEITNENSAGFKLCAFYALRHGFDKKIKVYKDMVTFGFAGLISEIERREWHDRFNPGFLE